MGAAALFALIRGGRDQLGGSKHVGEAPVARVLALNHTDLKQRLGKRGNIANHSNIFRHGAAKLVLAAVMLTRGLDLNHLLGRGRLKIGHSRRGGDIIGHTGAEHYAFEQRVGGEAVSAVRTGGSYLTASPQAIDGAAPLRVGENAAHVVVSCRSDGNRLARRIDGGRPASCEHSREMLGELRAESPAIEKGAAPAHDLAIDSARPNVAWGTPGSCGPRAP